MTEINVDAGSEDDEVQADSSGLPVMVSVSYKLDGKEILPEQLAGKSGKVEITLKYENRDVYNDNINGKDVKMNTPFVMVSAVVMDADIFSGIEVSQGKIMDEDDSRIVIGYSAPGLTDNLDLDRDAREDFEERLSDTVTITAVAENFELEPIYTVASSEFLSGLDLSDTEGIDDLEEALDGMVDASGELISGSSTLSNALSALDENFGTYAKGVKSLASGSRNLKKGTKELADGLKDYASGVAGFKQLADQYVAGVSGLADGIAAYIQAENAIAGDVGTLRENMETLQNDFAVLRECINAYMDNSGIADGGMVFGYLEQAVSDSFDNGTLTEEQKAACFELINGLRNPQSAGDEKEIKGNVERIESDLANTADTAGKIQAGISMLGSSYNETLAGTAKSIAEAGPQIKEGMKSISDNAAVIQSSGDSLLTGVKTLSNGADELNKATPDIAEGIGKMAEGSVSLTTGLETFKSEGTLELKGTFTDKIKNPFNRMKSLTEDKASYTGFAGNTDKNVSFKFIFQTEAIKLMEE